MGNREICGDGRFGITCLAFFFFLLLQTTQGLNVAPMMLQLGSFPFSQLYFIKERHTLTMLRLLQRAVSVTQAPTASG